MIAGFIEEIGWMGFAFPAMCSIKKPAFMSAVVLGVLWGVWHAPVIDYFGYGDVWLANCCFAQIPLVSLLM